MDPSASRLYATLERSLAGLGLGSLPVEPWARLAELIERWGRRLNLTGHPDALAIAERLLLEAAALERVLPPAARIADLGSGAGIPGLPIALCRPSSHVLLIEARERRHHFQRAAIRELGLANVEALHGRAEELPPRPSDGVVCQAVARSEQALAWMLPWLGPGGWVAIASVPGFSGPAHPRLVEVALHPYASPSGPPRAAWVARGSAS